MADVGPDTGYCKSLTLDGWSVPVDADLITEAGEFGGASKNGAGLGAAETGVVSSRGPSRSDYGVFLRDFRGRHGPTKFHSRRCLNQVHRLCPPCS